MPFSEQHQAALTQPSVFLSNPLDTASLNSFLHLFLLPSYRNLKVDTAEGIRNQTHFDAHRPRAPDTRSGSHMLRRHAPPAQRLQTSRSAQGSRRSHQFRLLESHRKRERTHNMRCHEFQQSSLDAMSSISQVWKPVQRIEFAKCLLDERVVRVPEIGALRIKTQRDRQQEKKCH